MPKDCGSKTCQDSTDLAEENSKEHGREAGSNVNFLDGIRLVFGRMRLVVAKLEVEDPPVCKFSLL